MQCYKKQQRRGVSSLLLFLLLCYTFRRKCLTIKIRLRCCRQVRARPPVKIGCAEKSVCVTVSRLHPHSQTVSTARPLNLPAYSSAVAKSSEKSACACHCCQLPNGQTVATLCVKSAPLWCKFSDSVTCTYNKSSL